MARTNANSDGDRLDDPEMVYHADGRLELRSYESGERWISTDEPQDIRR